MYKTKSGVAAIVVGVIMIILGVFFALSFILAGNSQLIPYTGVVSSDPLDIYDLGNVLVIDKYGYIESDTELNEDYYVIAFSAENDENIYLGSLMVDETMDVYEKLDDYSDDNTLYIGDLYMDLCASADTISTLDSDIHGYYNEAMDTCSELLPGFIDSGISFTYYCEGADAFPSALESERTFSNIVIIISAIVFAAGIAVLIIGINNHAKANKMMAAMPQPNVYYDPRINQQGTYYNPQQAPPAGGSYQNPQANAGQWTNGPQNNAQSGSGQWGAPAANSQQPPASPYQNQYYTTPPTKNDPGSADAPQDGSHNNPQ